MNYEEFQLNFIKWIKEKIEPMQNNGFAICPYAQTARIKNKIQFIKINNKNYEEFSQFDPKKYDIGIFWLEDNLENIEELLTNLKNKNKDKLYFLSTVDSGFFVKNFTNCILVQKKDLILKKRKLLHKTDYYKNWPIEYYNKIVEDNYE